MHRTEPNRTEMMHPQNHQDPRLTVGSPLPELVGGGVHHKEGGHDPRHARAHRRLGNAPQPGPDADGGEGLRKEHAVHRQFFKPPAEAAP